MLIHRPLAGLFYGARGRIGGFFAGIGGIWAGIGEACALSAAVWARFVVIAVVVGADDALDEFVADDVVLFEADEGDAVNAGEAAGTVGQTTFDGIGQVGLGGVACHDHLAALAHAGQEHLHLAAGAVLGFVENDDAVVEGSASHEGEGDDFDDVVLHEAADGGEVHHVVEGVEEWAEVGVDFVAQITGQETEALAGFDGGAREDDALDAA